MLHLLLYLRVKELNDIHSFLPLCPVTEIGMCFEALFLPFIETFLTLTSPFLLFQSGLVPGVCGCSPGFVAGHRKHPDSLLRPPISANLPPEEEPGAPEIRHKPPGSELNWWVSQIQTRQPDGFCVTELKGLFHFQWVFSLNKTRDLSSITKHNMM